MLLRRKNSVKNPYILLRQKEQDIARVRLEIQALLTVIPLLVDTESAWDELTAQLASSCPDDPTLSKNGMAGLELFYPFVKNLRLKNEPMADGEISIS
jgi:hypothetical protein